MIPRAIVRVSPELMADLLKLPPKTRILGSMGDAEAVAFIVEHPDLQPAGSGAALPTACPKYSGLDWMHAQFEGWGQ